MLTREDIRKKMITDPRGLVEWVMELQAERDRLRFAISQYLEYIEQKYPGEPLRCEYVQALADVLEATQ